MNHHLPDEQLWWLSEGGGTSEDRRHLEECAACTARYQQLVRDLEVLAGVLQEPPPVQTSPQPQRALRIRWVPAVAIMTLTLLLAWGQDWLRELASPGSTTGVRREEIVFLTKEIPLALFATAELNPGRLPARATNFSYLQAALDGGWPAEPCEPSRTSDCEPDLFLRLLEELEH
jgi:hypothetical protein